MSSASYDQALTVATINHGHDLWSWRIEEDYTIKSTSFETDRHVFSTAKAAFEHAMSSFMNGHDQEPDNRAVLRRKYVIHITMFWLYTAAAIALGYMFGQVLPLHGWF